MFFSVKKSIKLAGKTYIPCICYPCPRFLELTVKSLEEKGVARLHNEYVSFQNGKIIEVKENITKNDTILTKSDEITKNDTILTKSKKNKKKSEELKENADIGSVELEEKDLEEF